MYMVYGCGLKCNKSAAMKGTSEKKNDKDIASWITCGVCNGSVTGGADKALQCEGSCQKMVVPILRGSLNNTLPGAC